MPSTVAGGPAAPAPGSSARPLRIVALSGGVGGARFLRGLLRHLAVTDTAHDVTVVANTADDITLHGLRVCPDLDTVMYTLAGGVHEQQGWGRPDETFTVTDELRAHGADVAWFTLGDRDLATHLLRTQLLREGHTLSQVTERLCQRWRTGVRLLPMSDEPVETHVDVEAPDVTRLHFQEWWVRHHAALPATGFVVEGAADARPAPGVLDALAAADVVLLPPSNPVVSIGAILAVPGLREALRDVPVPVVGVSPIIAGAPVRGMADACLRAIGVPSTAEAVARLYSDLLDGWLVAAEDAPAPGAYSGPWSRPRPRATGLAVRSRPLVMHDADAAASIAGAALDLALELGGIPAADASATETRDSGGPR
ncbi:MAG: 2-phospho-L-lactate transferase [Kineosporiaceae bacterium]